MSLQGLTWRVKLYYLRAPVDPPGPDSAFNAYYD
jgi:hypothetical protein